MRGSLSERVPLSEDWTDENHHNRLFNAKAFRFDDSEPRCLNLLTYHASLRVSRHGLPIRENSAAYKIFDINETAFAQIVLNVDWRDEQDDKLESITLGVYNKDPSEYEKRVFVICVEKKGDIYYRVKDVFGQDRYRPVDSREGYFFRDAWWQGANPEKRSIVLG